MSTETKPLKVFFDKLRETKNTWVYTEDTKDGDEPERIGTIYLKKFVYKKMGKPERIEVIVKGA
jgi:hypothetical protein